MLVYRAILSLQWNGSIKSSCCFNEVQGQRLIRGTVTWSPIISDTSTSWFNGVRGPRLLPLLVARWSRPSKNSWKGVILASLEREWWFQLSLNSDMHLLIKGKKTKCKTYKSTSFSGLRTPLLSKLWNFSVNGLTIHLWTSLLKSFDSFVMDRATSNYTVVTEVMNSYHVFPNFCVFSTIVWSNTIRQPKLRYSVNK